MDKDTKRIKAVYMDVVKSRSENHSNRLEGCSVWYGRCRVRFEKCPAYRGISVKTGDDVQATYPVVDT